MASHAATDAVAKPWMKRVLLAAAAYNLLWGLSVIVAPGWMFSLAGMEPPRYVEIWQCVGMIVGVYGIGYGIAAFDPLRHWPIVLVGLLGKVFGPIGFAKALWTGSLPLAFGATILTNDLVWWAPFAMIVWAALKQEATTPDFEETGDPVADLRDAGGRTLAELSAERPVFAVLLRHAGCTFHREAVADLRGAAAAIENAGATIAVVHMGDDHASAAAAEGFPDARWVSDPTRRLYRHLDLPRGTFGQLFGPRVFVRGASACVLRGHGVGTLKGDGFQLGGMALLREGQVVWSRALADAADRPDYAAAAEEAMTSARRAA